MSAALLGLSDIAALARVSRPLVSVWRRRKAASTTPFPAPATGPGGRELFDAAEVASWLMASGLGNNPNASDDVALFALLAGTDRAGAATAADVVSALLVLAAAHDEPLAGMSRAALLDLADDVDPHDDAVYSELAALGDDLEEWAARTDVVVSAAYTPRAAFSALLAAPVPLGTPGSASARISPELSTFVARVARQDVQATGVHAPAGVVDAVLRLAGFWEDDERPALAAPSPTDRAGRFMRRAAMVAGWSVQPELPAGPTTGVVQVLPGTPAEIAASLALISELSLELRDGDRLVVVGPAAALVGPLRGEAALSRADALRTGRLRAVVHLPPGMRPAHPRERLALWVLGDAHPGLSLEERWTSVSDLTGERFEGGVVEDLFSDVCAALSGPRAVYAHASRFARVVPTRELLASDGALAPVVARRRRRRGASPAETALAVGALVGRVNAATPALALELWERGGVRPRVVTLGDLVTSGVVRVVRGCRVDPEVISASGGVPVLGVPEVTGAALRGSRSADRLLLSSRHPSFQYTEPGDVVVGPPASPGGFVDSEGFAVVEYPARALRIVGDAPGLSAQVLLSAVRAARPGVPWRAWPVALPPPEECAALERALADVEEVRAELAGRLAAADALRADLTAGVVDGVLALTPPSTSADMSL